MTEKTTEKITHRELCILGSEWLKKSLRCTISIYEPKGIKENPDAIGWRYSYGGARYEGSVLVECKTSRADFKQDFKKAFRIEPEKGVGNWRYYMCPTDVIKPEEVPEKWGLLYVNEKRKIKVIKNPYKDNLTKSKFNDINTECERFLLTRWLSKTEDPERIVMMLRETNNMNTRQAKEIQSLKAEKLQLRKFERLFWHYNKKAQKTELTPDQLVEEVDSLRNISYFLQEYSRTKSERTLEYVLQCVERLERKDT